MMDYQIDAGDTGYGHRRGNDFEYLKDVIDIKSSLNRLVFCESKVYNF